MGSYLGIPWVEYLPNVLFFHPDLFLLAFADTLKDVPIISELHHNATSQNIIKKMNIREEQKLRLCFRHFAYQRELDDLSKNASL